MAIIPDPDDDDPWKVILLALLVTFGVVLGVVGVVALVAFCIS